MEREDPKVQKERRLMLTLIGTSVGFATLSALLVAKDLVPKPSHSPDRLPPQVGDVLVHATGHTQGEPLDPAALPLGGPPLLAYPMDPKTKVVRSGDPKSTLLVLRLDPKRLAPEVARYAAGEVVVYSAVCTHLGCIVSLWRPEGVLQCPCHGGEYDPYADRVVAGPPPRPLPLLPVKAEGGRLVVAGPFTGPVGVVG
ncbi:(2Fe-2S)-binding protein (plasmid) [Thermus thermophilus]|uniref:(2Fe-2S)-binding protein n=1 Tax=Thermus thermophilus TaxID=274 RepID=A0AAD1NZ70_THETH|nr:Rieske (2Fe-2S) protein [Thermus thermophilus]BBL83341.1 (2Fe-2S)-binding protein [Thermus thermophilus]BBL85614.1 (2Fe-2S)-binding protein [Thermus thermophilus]BCZ88041.1 (2Fe-2S)-binding protein [Thermus thermophilus]BCZ90343.1 (2Fe-2S)-binding protein [Thermus thermophilus]BCZ93027.1 (2Fe-2S)-binding protein [Thermus thermophilus]